MVREGGRKGGRKWGDRKQIRRWRGTRWSREEHEGIKTKGKEWKTEREGKYEAMNGVKDVIKGDVGEGKKATG
jgi:hypothetical protein